MILQKLESDLVFEDDNPRELNLILSDSKLRSRRVQQSPSSTRNFPWKNNVSSAANKNSRFRWIESGKEDEGDFLGSIHNNKRTPQAQRKRKTATSERSSNSPSLSSSSSLRSPDLSRRRAIRVPDTDDEDLIYSGEEGEGSAVRPPGLDIYVPSTTTSGGRSDTGYSFEKRKKPKLMQTNFHKNCAIIS
jgi:hypothetical protein